MAIISRLAVLLGLDAGEFNANLGKAKDKVEGFSTGAKISLLAVGTAFAASAREAINFADKINDVAKANEMSVQSVLRMSNALTQNGGNSEDAGKLMASFANKVDEAAQGSEKAQKAFLSIGVSLKDLRTLAPQDLFEKTVKSLSAVEDTTRRNALAMDMFGRAMRGIDIKGFADDLDKTKNKFSESDEAFKKIGVSVDRLDKLFFNLKVNLAEGLAPAFDAATQAIERHFERQGKILQRFAEIRKEAGWWAAWKDREGIQKYNAPSEREYGSVQGANVPGIMSGIGGIAAPKKNIREVTEAKNKEAEAEAKRLAEAAKKQQEFYERELLISKAKGERLQKEHELAFLTENERKLQLELFDIEQKRQQLTLGDQFGRKMNQEQANAWAEAEKARAREAYQVGEAQRSFEFGWQKAFATYADNASNAAKLGEQAFVSVTQNLETALDNFVQTGKLSFSDLARSIISDLIKIQLKAQATAMFQGSGVGGFFSKLFGAVGGGGSGMFTGSTGAVGGSIHIGARAGGGDVSGGAPYLVGEQGPELMIPKTSGTIIPNNQLGSMGGGPQVVYNGPYIASMSAIDTQSATQFLSRNKQAVFAANQSATRSLPQSRS
jgi:lambda family phage tail tape measure protein